MIPWIKMQREPWSFETPAKRRFAAQAQEIGVNLAIRLGLFALLGGAVLVWTQSEDSLLALLIYVVVVSGLFAFIAGMVALFHAGRS